LYFSPCCSHDPAPTALYTLSLHDALPIYLDHQATWLENNQLSDFMSAPVQASQAAFDDSFNAWQQDINQFVQRAGESSRMSYHMSGVIFTVVVILAALLTGAALLWSRKMIVQPLAIISSHFDRIAKADLAR